MAIKFQSTTNEKDRKKMISAPIASSSINMKIGIIIENNQQLSLPNFGKFQLFLTRSAISGSLTPKSNVLKMFLCQGSFWPSFMPLKSMQQILKKDVVAFSTTPPAHMANILKRFCLISFCDRLRNIHFALLGSR